MFTPPINDLTVGISVKDNMQACLLCITSILTGSARPKTILLRIESTLPDFDNFYLGQLAALCRLHEVGFELHYCKSEGIHATRQWQVEHCKTNFLLFLDDDVVIDSECIRNLLTVADLTINWTSDRPIYFQGCKGDVNNRRGYGNFDLTIRDIDDVPSDQEINYNCFYLCSRNGADYRPVTLCDMGCLLLDVDLFRRHDLTFLASSVLTNAGGEDTLFALLCEQKKLRRLAVPGAVAYHLEKPFIRMSEHAYRKALVLRTAELTGLPTESIASKVLPWEPLYTFDHCHHVQEKELQGRVSTVSQPSGTDQTPSEAQRSAGQNEEAPGRVRHSRKGRKPQKAR